MALGIWVLALAAAIGAFISVSPGWTFYTPYSQSATPALWSHIAAIAALSALTVGALVGARAAQRRARFTAIALMITALVGAFAVVLRLLAGPLGEAGDNGLVSAALVLPAVGVLGTAVHGARWRGTPLVWAVIALSTLGVGIVRSLIEDRQAFQLHDIVYVGASQYYYFFFTAVAGLLGGIVASRPAAFGRTAPWTAIGFALGAHMLCATNVVSGVGGMPRRYAMYLGEEAFAYTTIPKMVGGALVLSVALWVLWSLRDGSRFQREVSTT